MNVKIFQIYYNEETRKALDPSFLPLNNCTSAHPEWYEFWPILNHLRKEGLPRFGEWLGFLSPKFEFKTGMPGQTLLDVVQNLSNDFDALLISYSWDQIAFFRNSFEQADHWHPTLSKHAQDFVDHAGIPLDIRNHVGTTDNTVFSNFIIAKADFWSEWLEIAEKLLEYVDQSDSDSAVQLRGKTSYGSVSNQAPTRAFMQERIANIVLASGQYCVKSIMMSSHASTIHFMYANTAQNRHLINTLNILKQEFCKTGNPEMLEMFYKLRKLVELATNVSCWDR